MLFNFLVSIVLFLSLLVFLFVFIKKIHQKKVQFKDISSLIGKEIFIIKSCDEFNKGEGVLNDSIWSTICLKNNYINSGSHAIIIGNKNNVLIVKSK